MTQGQQLDDLISYLLRERKSEDKNWISDRIEDKQRLFRSLMNLRPPAPIDREFLEVQNEYLQNVAAKKGITRMETMSPVKPGVYLWQGDITTLAVDAIVNAANSQMLGCFVPCHNCIDNAIHSAAGVQLRWECAQIMGQRLHYPTGEAMITKAYNLPCRYILHTVGPVIQREVTDRDRALLSRCYHSCLELAAAHGLKTVAFCCISTGEFHFPNELAARIAVQSVSDYQQKASNGMEVIFNVFKDVDRDIYQRLLG